MTTLIGILIVAFSSFGDSNFQLRSLKDVSTKTIQTQVEQTQVFMVFQKDCQACRKQVPKLKCLQVPVTLLGAFSTEKQLRKEYQKIGSRYPAFLATQSILTDLGVSEPLTPQTILVTPSQKIAFRGTTTCKNIQKYVVNPNG